MDKDIQLLKTAAGKVGREIVESPTAVDGKFSYVKDRDGHVVELRLNRCNLQDNILPEDLWELRHLEVLEMSWNMLQAFPRGVLRLELLKKLSLNINSIRTLPKELANMDKLESLDLADNRIWTIPCSLGHMKSLKHLRLNANEIASLPNMQGEFCFPKLKIMDMDQARVRKLPEWIYYVPELEALSLTGMRLSRLPEMEKFQRLKRLYLDSVDMPDWPDEIHLPNTLCLLVLDGSSLEHIPKTVIERKPHYYRNQREAANAREGFSVSLGERLASGKEASKLFSEDREEAYEYLKCCESKVHAVSRGLKRMTDLKVVLLGDGGVGKSSLVQKLCQQDPDDERNVLVDLPPTHGVNVDESVSIGQYISDIEEDVTVHFWDFGGQNKYLALNRLLLSDKAIFILVLDARNSSLPEQWLAVIKHYAPQAKVILVVNKNDQGIRRMINFDYYYKKYAPLLYEEMFKISCLVPSQGVNRISGILEAVAKIIQKRTDYFLPLWGVANLFVKDEVDKQFQSSKKKSMPFDSFLELCEKNGIRSEEASSVVRELHDIGSCIYFWDESSVIFNPKWLADSLYSLYQMTGFERAELEENELANMIRDSGQCPGFEHDIIRILNSRKILYRWEDSKTSIKKVFCPFFLPETRDASARLRQSGMEYQYSLFYETNAQPEIEFYYLLISLYSIYKDRDWHAWQYGLIFFEPNSQCCVLISLQGDGVEVRVFAPSITGSGLCFFILARHLNEAFQAEGQKVFVLSQEGKQNIKMRAETIRILYQSDHKRYYLESEDGRLLEANIEKLYRAFGMDRSDYCMEAFKEEKMEIQIFLSYCHEDKDVADKIYSYFNDSKKIVLKMDEFEVKKFESFREYMNTINDVDFVIVLVSSHYLKSANCMYEMLEVIRNRAYKDRIFPAVLDKTIYKPLGRAEYVLYWQNEKKELERMLSRIDTVNQGSLADDLARYQDIASKINNFMDMISDMNNPDIDDVNISIEEALESRGFIRE